MAALVGRASREALIKVSNASNVQNARQLSFKTMSAGKKAALAGLAALTAGGVGFVTALGSSVFASDLLLHPPNYPWVHMQQRSSFDKGSLRRGYEVYKQVCAACHSMKYIHYRDMVGVIFTEEEAKNEAAEQMVLDGPNDAGEMYERKGKLTDTFPSPYKNTEAAMAANNGVEPPDLSVIVNARHGEENYIFSLLTGYKDPPAGVTVGEGQHYNPYFKGGLISMAQALYNEIIEYTDGTPATQSQLAKDVTEFLAWTSEFDHDQRKLWTVKAFAMFAILLASTSFWARHRWAHKRSKQVFLKP